jgi:hypothetical protein
MLRSFSQISTQFFYCIKSLWRITLRFFTCAKRSRSGRIPKASVYPSLSPWRALTAASLTSTGAPVLGCPTSRCSTCCVEPESVRVERIINYQQITMVQHCSAASTHAETDTRNLGKKNHRSALYYLDRACVCT